MLKNSALLYHTNRELILIKVILCGDLFKTQAFKTDGEAAKTLNPYFSG